MKFIGSDGSSMPDFGTVGSLREQGLGCGPDCFSSEEGPDDGIGRRGPVDPGPDDWDGGHTDPGPDDGGDVI